MKRMTRPEVKRSGTGGRHWRYRRFRGRQPVSTSTSFTQSSTMRTARSRTSGANLFVVSLIRAPSSQELGPPAIPERLKEPAIRSCSDFGQAGRQMLRQRLGTVKPDTFGKARDEPRVKPDEWRELHRNQFGECSSPCYSRLRHWEGTLQMRVNLFICAAIVAAMMPAVALADDPHDPTMRSAAARARDRAMIRQLNLEEYARVRQRDARNARIWHSTQVGGSYAADDEYAARSRDHERAMANYTRSRVQHEREMAEWRRAVTACRAGDYSACDN